ncbi:MAG: hypothetical protein QGH45_16495 [Myxococcota bacterium]|nr:hypothetical protein [Myxococcota bacterium]
MPRRLIPVLALLFAAISAGSAAAQNGSGDEPSQGPSGPPPGGDPIAWILATLDLDEEALGVHPRGHHTRFPLPGDMPHTLPFFADLWAEPLRTYDWAADMARYSRTYLDPAYLAGVGASWPGDMEATDQPRPDAAYHLLFHLGICRLTTRFRDYSVNLTPRTFGDRPLVEAVAELRELGGIGTSLVTFGRDADFPRPRDEAERAAEGIDPELQRIVATAMLDLADARRWIDLAFRNVDWEDRLAVWRILDLSEIQLDGLRYDPAVDDVIAALDRESLLYGGMKAVRIAEELRARLRAWQAAHPRASAGLDYQQMTPYGRVVIAGSGNDLHTCTDCMLLIDLGGNDTYEMAVGAPPDPDLPLAVAVDMAGKDEYRPAPFGLPTQGAGAMGVGILWDVAGDDRYLADGPLAQGVAQVGVGLLMDEAGDDVFQAATAAQGAAFFGVGMLVDIEGADRFTCHGECQGFGGSGGAGVLVNGRGDDVYTAEVMPDKVYRPDYHAGMERNITSAQGVGLGRRGDGGDGHSWAGGLGVLLDGAGNDRYEAGTFSQGCGYWFGTGVLYEGGGDDVYESVNFSHGSGAHFCIGAVIDEQGNDEHKAVHTGTCALGFGWDYTNALMFDRQGDDLYVGHEAVLGVANGRSNALAIDLAGDDRYELSGAGGAFGQAGVMPQIDHRDPSRPYFHDGTSLGLFLDADGGDSYLRAGQPDPVAADSFFTLTPAPGDPRYELLNFGVGLDASGGVPAAFTLPPEE